MVPASKKVSTCNCKWKSKPCGGGYLDFQPDFLEKSGGEVSQGYEQPFFPSILTFASRVKGMPSFINGHIPD